MTDTAASATLLIEADGEAVIVKSILYEVLLCFSGNQWFGASTCGSLRDPMWSQSFLWIRSVKFRACAQCWRVKTGCFTCHL